MYVYGALKLPLPPVMSKSNMQFSKFYRNKYTSIMNEKVYF